MSIISNIVGRVTRGAAAIFDKGVQLVTPPKQHLSYQRLQSKATKTRHADLAMIASRRRRFRDVVLSVARCNNAGLPLGVSPAMVAEAKHIEALANTGRIGEAGVGETAMRLADQTLTKLKENRAARRGRNRPSKLARRVRKGMKTCRASVMVQQQAAARAAFGQ